VAATNDTAFFRAYGDKGYDLNYYKQTDIQQHPKLAELFTQAKNSIVGPYIDKDNVRAIKILDRKNISDSVFAKALTISFQDVAQNQDGIAKRLKLVDSIFKMLDTMNMDFDQIAAQYSADRGQNPPVWITTAEKIWNPEIFIHGGVKRYFKSPSDREGVVRIIKVLNFPANIPAVQMGEISSPYAPSTETQQSIYNNALSFIQKCKTAKDIVTLSKSNPLVKSNTLYVTQDNNSLEGIEGNGRESIRWAFDSKSGDISSMMQVGNNYVYCGNLGLRSKDHVEFADVEDDLLPDFKAEKAFKLIGEKLNGANLNEIASKNATTVQSIQGLSFNNSAINQMPEPALVAVASGLAVNKLSKPIRGTGGVYRIMNTKVNPTTVTPAEELNTKTQMNQQFKNMQGILEGMLNRYEIKDNRANMF